MCREVVVLSRHVFEAIAVVDRSHKSRQECGVLSLSEAYTWADTCRVMASPVVHEPVLLGNFSFGSRIRNLAAWVRCLPDERSWTRAHKGCGQRRRMRSDHRNGGGFMHGHNLCLLQQGLCFCFLGVKHIGLDSYPQFSIAIFTKSTLVDRARCP
ncbi:hypothetical protein PsAD14_04198 [Pseudovibrio sp. Ad14]|nr:hypothetical protein PsW74_04115 [Pseudovibrio sp. W74]KZL07808.1 hypothetical protein PsAD14_04198 [Pseudovibrio sp. Ad14]